MIPFAGKDPFEHNLWGPRHRRTQGAIAYERFDLGWDTMMIAQHMNIPEAKALKLITIERSKLLSKPSPYDGECSE